MKREEKEILCKKCYTPLTGKFRTLGVCERCLPSELDKIRKRLVISAAAGLFLALLLAGVYVYALKTHYVSDMRGYEGDIFVPVFSFHLAFNPRTFERMMNYSVGLKAFWEFFVFCIPFSSFVKLEIKTKRHEMEQKLYEIGDLGAKLAASSNNQRMDDAGMFLMSLMVSAVSGPFFLVYRLYKLAQFSSYVKKTTA